MEEGSQVWFCATPNTRRGSEAEMGGESGGGPHCTLVNSRYQII